jgi:hypothetical protein
MMCVRRCMVQDMLNPEYFTGVFPIRHRTTGEIKMQTGVCMVCACKMMPRGCLVAITMPLPPFFHFFCASAVCARASTNDSGKYQDNYLPPNKEWTLGPASSEDEDEIVYERSVLTCIAIPGESQWVRDALQAPAAAYQKALLLPSAAYAAAAEAQPLDAASAKKRGRGRESGGERDESSSAFDSVSTAMNADADIDSLQSRPRLAEGPSARASAAVSSVLSARTSSVTSRVTIDSAASGRGRVEATVTATAATAVTFAPPPPLPASSSSAAPAPSLLSSRTVNDDEHAGLQSSFSPYAHVHAAAAQADQKHEGLGMRDGVFSCAVKLYDADLDAFRVGDAVEFIGSGVCLLVASICANVSHAHVCVTWLPAFAFCLVPCLALPCLALPRGSCLVSGFARAGVLSSDYPAGDLDPVAMDAKVAISGDEDEEDDAKQQQQHQRDDEKDEKAEAGARGQGGGGSHSGSCTMQMQQAGAEREDEHGAPAAALGAEGGAGAAASPSPRLCLHAITFRRLGPAFPLPARCDGDADAPAPAPASGGAADASQVLRGAAEGADGADAEAKEEPLDVGAARASLLAFLTQVCGGDEICAQAGTCRARMQVALRVHT